MSGLELGSPALTVPMYVVEAFNLGCPFTGNLAGVCILDYIDHIPDSLMQKIAAQMSVPVTAFIAPSPASLASWTIRWFTPTIEAPLCGHATFASAFVIFNLVSTNWTAAHAEKVTNTHTRVSFDTKNKGQLHASMDWDTGLISLDFPLCNSVPLASVSGSGEEAWGLALMEATLGPNVPTTSVLAVQAVPDRGYLLYHLKNSGTPDGNAELLRAVRPDFAKMVQIETGSPFHVQSVCVTVQGHEWNETELEPRRPHFYSRNFVPWAGINEDPVTGSAHTMLAPYWVRELRKQGQELNQTKNAGGTLHIRGQQLSARGGEILCTILEGYLRRSKNEGTTAPAGDGVGRVQLTGHGRLSLSGEFYL